MGIGSSLKKAIKKIVPKELGDVAQVAALIPGPHQPIAAGLAALGGYRDDGFSGALKKGLGSYMGGQFTSGLARGSQFGPGWMQRGFGSDKTWLPSSMKESGFTPLDWLGDPIRGAGERTGEGISNLFTPAEASSNIKSSVDVATSPANTSAIEGGQSIMGPEGTIIDSTTNEVIAKGGEIVKTKMVENPTFADQVIKFLNMNEEGKAAQLVQMALSEKGIMIGRGLAAYLATKAGNEVQPQFRSWEEIPTNMYNLQYENARDGGIIGLANGGEPTMEMDYRGGGFIPVGAQERADDVPARLSKNEFVMTADAVRAAGGGSVDVGAQRMYNLMNQLEGAA